MENSIPRPRGRPRDNAYKAHNGRSVLIRVRAMRSALQGLRLRLDAEPEVLAALIEATPHRCAWWADNARVLADVLSGWESILQTKERERRG